MYLYTDNLSILLHVKAQIQSPHLLLCEFKNSRCKYQMDFLHLPESYFLRMAFLRRLSNISNFFSLGTSSEAVCVFSTSFMSLKLSSEHQLVSFHSHWLFQSKHHHGQHLIHSEEDGNCWPALLLWLFSIPSKSSDKPKFSH